MASVRSSGEMLQNLFNAAAGAASGIGGDIIRMQEEAARTKLRTSQLQYQMDAQTFLQSLQSSNDFGNWEQRTEDFLTKYRNNLMAGAGNNLSAKYLGQQMDANRADLMMQVRESAFNGIRKEMFEDTNRGLDLNRQLYSGQEAVENAQSLLQETYRNGLIDKTQYDSMLQDNVTKIAYSDYTKEANGVIADAIRSGKSWEQASADIDSRVDALVPYSLAGVSYGDDVSMLYGAEQKSGVMASVLDSAHKKYIQDLENFRNSNEQFIVDTIFTQLESTSNPELKEIYKTQGRSLLETLMDDNRLSLSTSQLEKWKIRFAPDELRQANTGSPGGGGSRGSGPKASTTKRSDVEKFIKDLFPAVIAGDYAKVEGISTYDDYEAYVLNYISDSDLPQDDKDICKANMLQWMTDSFVNYIKKDGSHNGYAQVFEDTDAWVKREIRNGSLTDEMGQNLVFNLYKKAAGMTLTGEDDVQEFRTYAEQQKGFLTSKKITMMQESRSGDSKFMDTYINRDGSYKDFNKMLADGFAQLDSGMLAYESMYGDTKYINGQSKKSVEALKKAGLQAVRNATGYDDLVASNDKNGNITFYSATGRTSFRIKSDGKKYWIEDRTDAYGSEWRQFTTQQRETEKRKAAEAARKKETKAAKKTAKEATKSAKKQAAASAEKDEQDYQRYLGQMTSPPSGVSWNEWNNRSGVERYKILDEKGLLKEHFGGWKRISGR